MKRVGRFLVPEPGEDKSVCGSCTRDLDYRRGYRGGVALLRVRERGGPWAVTFVCDGCYPEARRSAKQGPRGFRRRGVRGESPE